MDTYNEDKKSANQVAEEYVIIIQLIFMVVIAIFIFTFCYCNCSVDDLREHTNGQDDSEWTTDTRSNYRKVRKHRNVTV